MSAPVERPIIFSGPMVRALLAGRKTQTRRLVSLPPWLKRQDPNLAGAFPDKAFGVTPCLRVPCADRSLQRLRNPWGFPNGTTDPQTGRVQMVPTRLWVRETWQTPWMGASQMFPPSPESAAMYEVRPRAVYAADWQGPPAYRWCPSIHMPRWAARLVLEVTEVRVQRLQDISEEDAQAEGSAFDDTEKQSPCQACSQDPGDTKDLVYMSRRWNQVDWDRHLRSQGLGLIGSPCHWHGLGRPWRCVFATLWDDINGKRAPWAENPWVWCPTFKLVEGLRAGAARPAEEVHAP